jgi:hypothetical protein
LVDALKELHIVPLERNDLFFQYLYYLLAIHTTKIRILSDIRKLFFILFI